MAVPVAAPTPTSIRGKNRLRRELQTEFVSAGTRLSWYGKQDKTVLPWSIDEITGEYGTDIYAKMLLDSQVSACVNVFKAAIIEEGLVISPAVSKPDDDGYELAREISDRASRMIEDLDTPFDHFLWNMMDAIAFGHKLAEQIYKVQDGNLDLAMLKVKPLKALAFVVDQYLNIIGLVGDRTGLGMVSNIDPGDILPRYKFVLLSWRPKDGDPRGTSMIRPAYESWWRKRQIIPDYLAYLSQFASPSVIGIAPENAESSDEEDTDGNTLTPVQALLNSLLAFRNSTALAVPFGTEIEFAETKGNGVAFVTAIANCNADITKAILTQRLATEESANMARAAAQVHQDVLDTLVRQGKRAVVNMIRRDILAPWVSYNWGPTAAQFVPHCSLGTVEHQDMAPFMQAIAALHRGGYFTEGQLPEVDNLLGLPIRTLQDEPVEETPPPTNNDDDSENENEEEEE